MGDFDEVSKDGMMKKQGKSERYFVLKGPVLYYYVRKTDTIPKGTIVLSAGCQVSTIRGVDAKKKQFIFDITWPSNIQSTDENNDKSAATSSSSSANQSRLRIRGFRNKKEEKNQAGKVAATAAGGIVAGSFTAGLGLLAGMMLVGGSGNNSYHTNNDAHKQITLQCDSLRDAEDWVDAIKKQINDLGDNLLGIPYVPGSGGLSVHSIRNDPPPELRLDEVEEWIKSSRWKVYSTHNGIRIFEQQFHNDGLVTIPKPEDVRTAEPCLRVNIGIHGSASEVHAAISSFCPPLSTGVIKSVRVVEERDNETEIIHLMLEPIYLHPTWTAPRDFCLLKYSKHNSDGTKVICLDSTFHQDCPLVEGCIRAELHAAYYIAPVRDEDGDDDQYANECLLTLVAQLNPKGWIWKTHGYQHNFVEQYLLHVLDIRDAIEAERFVHVHFDPVTEQKITHGESASQSTPEVGQSLGTVPTPTLPRDMWGEAEASTFRVRGATYLHDKVKANSQPSLLKLVAVDVFEVPETTHNIASNPRNRVALALQRGEKFWAFVFNIMIPGPPYISFVMYYQGDKSIFEQDTPFTRIAKPFFFGGDDEFRNNRFKLIPKVVDGNMIVKMAVKDTPTLLGNKLKQYYYRDDHYFEIDVDVGSSSVARNVVGLALGYSKAIVVDMGVCLQGNEESELPEIMIGACSCIHVDMSLAKKL